MSVLLCAKAHQHTCQRVYFLCMYEFHENVKFLIYYSKREKKSYLLKGQSPEEGLPPPQ